MRQKNGRKKVNKNGKATKQQFTFCDYVRTKICERYDIATCRFANEFMICPIDLIQLIFRHVNAKLTLYLWNKKREMVFYLYIVVVRVVVVVVVCYRHWWLVGDIVDDLVNNSASVSFNGKRRKLYELMKNVYLETTVNHSTSYNLVKHEQILFFLSFFFFIKPLNKMNTSKAFDTTDPVIWIFRTQYMP